jgi:membrane-bound metal-dependent hydrolase YbcI (DUF457 family)
MKGFTHALCGLLVGIVLDAPIQFLWIPVLFALLPDIDYHKSTLGKFFTLFNYGVEHRGILHSLLGVVLIGGIWFLIFGYWMLWIVVLSYTSHLLLDALNYSGIRVFYPFHFKIKGFCKSGGFVDFILGLTFVISIVWILVKTWM